MTLETGPPGTVDPDVPAEPGVVAPSALGRLDVRAVDQGIRDELVSRLGTRRDPDEPGRKVERVWLLRTHLDELAFAVVLHWLSSRKRASLETQRGYADDLLRLCRWLQERFGPNPVALLADLRTVTVTNWVVWADHTGRSPRTQQRLLSAVSSLFNYAIAHGVHTSNPVCFEDHTHRVDTDSQGRPDRAARVLPLAQVAAMRVQCRTPGEYLAFDLLYEQGLRESEVAALDAADFDTAASPVSVSVTRKGRKHAVRSLDSETAVHLTQHLHGRESGPVFINPNTGKPRDRHYLIRLTRRLAKHAGLPTPNTVTPHCLRATAITGLLDDGYPLHEVQKWAAHAHSSTTQVYWDRTNAPKRDAALSSALVAKLKAATAGIAADHGSAR